MHAKCQCIFNCILLYLTCRQELSAVVCCSNRPLQTARTLYCICLDTLNTHTEPAVSLSQGALASQVLRRRVVVPLASHVSGKMANHPVIRALPPRYSSPQHL